MKKQKKQHTWVIHLRHIFPAVSDILLLILMLIPTFCFSISSKYQPKQSVFELIKNSWQGSREYLFSATAQTTPQGEAMYRAIFIFLIAFTLLFIIGVLINLFSMIVSYKDMNDPAAAREIKNVYLAFIPNRIMLSLFRLFVIPIFLLPDIVARYYRVRLFQSVYVKYPLLHPAIIAALLFAVTVIITVISKKYEISEKRDVFFKKSAQKPVENVTDEADDEPQERVYRIDESSDTSDRIRRMFEDK